MMANLSTSNPIALQHLFNSEVIFNFQGTFEETAHDHLLGSLGNEVVTDLADSAINEAYTFSTLGNNQRQILYLIHDKLNDFFSDETYDAFVKTIAALKLTLDDIVVINLARTPKIDRTVLYAKYAPKKVVLSGLSPDLIEIADLAFHNPRIIDGVALLYTYAFAEMLTDIGKKKAFWHQLKNFIM